MPTIKGRNGSPLGDEGMWVMPVSFAPLESVRVKGVNFESGCVIEDILLVFGLGNTGTPCRPGEKMTALEEKAIKM
jgi:hypothetical protein